LPEIRFYRGGRRGRGNLLSLSRGKGERRKIWAKELKKILRRERGGSSSLHIFEKGWESHWGRLLISITSRKEEFTDEEKGRRLEERGFLLEGGEEERKRIVFLFFLRTRRLSLLTDEKSFIFLGGKVETVTRRRTQEKSGR